jgi:hypothetical protein
MLLTDNFLTLEALLVARLKANFDGSAKVLTAADLKGAATLGQFAPAVFVMYDGYRLPGEGGSANQGGAQMLDQLWTIVVVVRNVADPLNNQGVRNDAGALLATLFAALLGWKPGPAFRPLRAANPPRPSSADGVGYFPSSFSTRVTLQGSP